MRRFLGVVIRHSKISILFIIAATVFFGVNAASIVINPDFYSIFPQENKRVERLYEETGIRDSLEMHLYLSVESDDEFTVGQIQLFYRVLTEIESNPAVLSSINPFNFLTFRNDRGRLSVESIASSVPETEAEADLFMDRLLAEPLARNFIVTENGRGLNALFVNSKDVDSAEFTDEFIQIITPLFDSFTVYYTGDHLLAARTAGYLQKDLMLLVGLAVIVILFILFLSFKSLRAVFLPIITVAAGAVWSTGFSALLGYDLTVVSVVLPVIVLAIGSSYTVHILSEYFREFGNSGENADVEHEICVAVSHVMRTVILAGITTIIGFCSLLTTSIAPVREFGLSVSFGILSCVILSLIFLPALLSGLKPPHPRHRERIAAGILNRIISFTGRTVQRFYPVFIFIFAAVITASVFLYPEISRKVDYIDYFPAEDPVVISALEVIESTGGGQSVNITLKAPEQSVKYFLRNDVMEKIDKLQDAIAMNPNVLSLTSFYTILEQINGVMFGRTGMPESRGITMLLARYFKMMGERDITFAADAEFVNSDYSQVTLFLKVYNSETGKVIADRDIQVLIEDLQIIIDDIYGSSGTYHIWGNTPLFYEAGDQIQHDQLFSTLLSMVMIVIVSFIFFRSFLLGFFSLIPLIFAIALNYILMVALQIPLDVTTVLVSNVAIGVGVDDAIHFILQYRNQVFFADGNYRKALSDTFYITGRPIILTTVSIVAGFLMLCFASFKPIVYFGLLVSISLTAAMLATLLFLPAFIAVYNRIRKRA